jgi:hypothetical protein
MQIIIVVVVVVVVVVVGGGVEEECKIWCTTEGFYCGNLCKE